MNVEELLESKKLPYKKQGNDFVVSCINPEHEDSHPSMRIDCVLGVFHCLSCGFKGNIFYHFDESFSKLDIYREKLKRKIQDIRLSSIGLQMPTGYMPYAGTWRNIKAETYIKFEAFRHHDKDFISRLVFPIRDLSGKIVCFIGRDEANTLEQRYKIHPRQAKLPLYPANPKPIKGRVMLVEGIFDMINLHDKGLDNSTCIFGTNAFNEDKLNSLVLQGITGIDILFDGDKAGYEAADKVKELCEEHNMSVRKIKMREGNDPGSLSENEVRKLKSTLYD